MTDDHSPIAMGQGIIGTDAYYGTRDAWKIDELEENSPLQRT